MNSNADAVNGRRPQKLQQDNLDSECQEERREPNVEPNCKMDNFRKSQTLTFILEPAKRKSSTTIKVLLQILTLIVLNSLLNQITYITNRVNHHYNLDATSQQTSYPPQSFLSSALARANLPTIILADAAECQYDDDCGREKVCHENKCICTREKPIELDQDRCLPRTLIDEQCVIDEQCLGNSNCIDGICSCGNDAISLYNPSAKISYCHPKRGLNDQCNHDLQCPTNAYCSTKKSGCLCQNGYAEAVVNNDGKESRECLSKFCRSSDTCESKFYECDDNKCKCLAAHFDPTTAKCYEYGSTGGLTLDGQPVNNGTDRSQEVVGKTNDTTVYTIIKDLMENGDKMWLVLLILITLSIIILVLIFILVKKYYAGICWTTHKKEYEPNNKNPPKNGYFNKNSINNKSFRKKSGEVDDEENDETAADRSNLVSDSDSKSNDKNAKTGSQYVKIDMNDKRDEEQNHHYGTPLSTSTSTPV